VAEAFAEGDLRGEAVVALKGGSVGIGSGDVAGLHGDELFVSVEVEVLGEDAGTDEFFLKDGDEVEEVLGLAATDVIHGIGWDGEAVVALLALGGALHHAHDAFYDVIDIGEVATAVAVVVDLDGVALEELVGEAEIGHIGTAGRTIDGEETQAGRGDVVELTVAVGHELVTLLGGGVEGHGVIYAVVGREGDFFVAAVDGARRGVDKVLHRMVAAGLEDVVEADEVGLDISIGIGDGIADTCLGGQVHYHIEMVLIEEFIDQRFIGNVSLDKLIIATFWFQGLQLFEA